MTAKALLHRLRDAGIVVDFNADGLTTRGVIPPDLRAMLALLHTGVLSAISGKRWFGYCSANGKPVVLNTGDRLPDGIDRLCVEGPHGWHTLPATAMVSHPELWAFPPVKRKAA